jgi:hypothetical protein
MANVSEEARINFRKKLEKIFVVANDQSPLAVSHNKTI